MYYENPISNHGYYRKETRIDKSVLKDGDLYYDDEKQLYVVKTAAGEQFNISPDRFSILSHEYEKREKSKKTAYRLCLLLGFLGVHRFYLGDMFKGVLLFGTFGGMLVGWLLDFLLLGSRVDEVNRQIATELLIKAIEDTQEDKKLEKGVPSKKD